MFATTASCSLEHFGNERHMVHEHSSYFEKTPGINEIIWTSIQDWHHMFLYVWSLYSHGPGYYKVLAELDRYKILWTRSEQIADDYLVIIL